MLRRLTITAGLLVLVGWVSFAVYAQTYRPGSGGGGATLSGNQTFTGNNTFTGTNTFQDVAKFQVQNQADATKVFEINMGGNATGITSTLAFGDTSNSTHTFPTNTGGTVAESNFANAFTAANSHTAAETHTGNELFNAGGSGFTLRDATDGTKKIQFDLSTMTTATTATWQFGPVGQLRAPSVGTAAAPMLSNPGGTTGIFFNASGPSMQFSGAGTDSASVQAANSSAGIEIVSGNSLAWSSTASSIAAQDLFLRRRAAANLNLGTVDAAGPVNQTISVQGSRGGTDTNVGGGTLTIGPGQGTGNATGNQLSLNRDIMQASGTTAQTSVNAVTVCESKTLSNTSATTTALANISAPSNSSGGAFYDVSVQCNDGTNFDSENVSCSVSWVNKATVFTVGTVVCTATTAANNSGSCTIASTVTGAGSTISINVVPVITTIAPTTTTGYITVHNHSAGAVTCG